MSTNSEMNTVMSTSTTPAIPTDPDALLSFAQGCTLLGIGRRLAWSLVNRGELPHLRVGRLIRFRRSSLAGWIDQRERGGDCRR